MSGIGGDAAWDGLVGDLSAVGERLPEDGARGDELAGDPFGRVDEAAGITPKVEHDALHAGVDERLELAVEVVGGRGREAVEPDVADGPVGQALAGHDLGLDGVADDGQLEGRGRAANDRQPDRGAARTADAIDRLADGLTVDGHVIDGQDPVLRLQAGRGRRRVAQRAHDHDVTVRSGLGTADAGRVLGLHHGPDALEAAVDAGDRGLVLVRGQIAAERVADGLEHALDGALDQRLLVGLADEAPGDGVERVPEGREEGLAIVGRARRPRLLAAEHEAGAEEGGAADDRHEEQDDDDGDPTATRRPTGSDRGRLGRGPARPSGVAGSASCAARASGVDGSGVDGSDIGRWSVSGGGWSEREAYLMR